MVLATRSLMQTRGIAHLHVCQDLRQNRLFEVPERDALGLVARIVASQVQATGEIGSDAIDLRATVAARRYRPSPT